MENSIQHAMNLNTKLEIYSVEGGFSTSGEGRYVGISLSF
jgi:hypothetical protein